MAIDDQNTVPEGDSFPDGNGDDEGRRIWPLVAAGLIGVAAAVVIVILAFGVFDDDDDEAQIEAVTQTATEEPTATPTEEPTEAPTNEPTGTPTDEPTEEPTEATDSSESALVLYFPVEADDGTELVTVDREPDDDENLEELAVEELLEGPTDEEVADNPGMFTPIPEDTTLLSFTLENGLATVDLSEEVLEVENDEEAILIIAMIESTLDEFDTVDEVVITVGGEEDQL
jgi:spore germination protein GerM